MKIAISAKGESLNSETDQRFGRCEYYIILDSDTETIIKTAKNENIDASGGAGTKTAQNVIREGAEIVITGNIGPNAYNVLDSAKIKIFTGISGTVGESIRMFKAGQLKQVFGNTVRGHH